MMRGVVVAVVVVLAAAVTAAPQSRARPVPNEKVLCLNTHHSDDSVIRKDNVLRCQSVDAVLSTAQKKFQTEEWMKIDAAKDGAN
ncbi:hypothetical protein HCZ30_07105 [Marivivens donghaensis]|uniref:Uncharacterized protein n=1 Tax=Marivivens donghaensis TaxID=1699413 RepID=A0ABX0VVS2_9RHOB|nr:hypothetical protein [Marivivens donghaensis]NIY72201.1 hypothetical protein [Marivivens donghaensis]